MSTIKKFLNLIFIDGLSGMALGLFSTLIIGTILKQAADLIGGDFGYYLGVFAVPFFLMVPWSTAVQAILCQLSLLLLQSLLFVLSLPAKPNWTY